ncbi:MAG: hypothetical protein FAF04_06990 [Epsilonproteobacteria bacterium]|nr:hypothetical protein [Campylobacterota bacterium]
MQEFSEDAPNTPVAKEIVSAFDFQIHDNDIKTNIVKAFDKGIEKFRALQKLLERKCSRSLILFTKRFMLKV